MQTRIYRKKYVNGSVNSVGHQKNETKTGMTLNEAYIYFLCYQKPNTARVVRQSLSLRKATLGQRAESFYWPWFSHLYIFYKPLNKKMLLIP
jgi:hypothetical protein